MQAQTQAQVQLPLIFPNDLVYHWLEIIFGVVWKDGVYSWLLDGGVKDMFACNDIHKVLLDGVGRMEHRRLSIESEGINTITQISLHSRSLDWHYTVISFTLCS